MTRKNKARVTLSPSLYLCDYHSMLLKLTLSKFNLVLKDSQNDTSQALN